MCDGGGSRLIVIYARYTHQRSANLWNPTVIFSVAPVVARLINRSREAPRDRLASAYIQKKFIRVNSELTHRPRKLNSPPLDHLSFMFLHANPGQCGNFAHIFESIYFCPIKFCSLYLSVFWFLKYLKYYAFQNQSLFVSYPRNWVLQESFAYFEHFENFISLIWMSSTAFCVEWKIVYLDSWLMRSSHFPSHWYRLHRMHR